MSRLPLLLSIHASSVLQPLSAQARLSISNMHAIFLLHHAMRKHLQGTPLSCPYLASHITAICWELQRGGAGTVKPLPHLTSEQLTTSMRASSPTSKQSSQLTVGHTFNSCTNDKISLGLLSHHNTEMPTVQQKLMTQIYMCMYPFSLLIVMLASCSCS
jgi:hypothetical protein